MEWVLTGGDDVECWLIDGMMLAVTATHCWLVSERSERCIFPFTLFLSTSVILLSSWPSSATTCCLSIPVLSLLNFFTNSLGIIGRRCRYFLTSWAVMVLGESDLLRLAGGWAELAAGWDSASRFVPVGLSEEVSGSSSVCVWEREKDWHTHRWQTVTCVCVCAVVPVMCETIPVACPLVAVVTADHDGCFSGDFSSTTSSCPMLDSVACFFISAFNSFPEYR